MTIVEIRNALTKPLEEYLGIPVVLSEQTNPVPDMPLCYYSILTPYAPIGEAGEIARTLNADGKTITTTRTENPYAVFSFTVCSENRHEDKIEIGEYVAALENSKYLAALEGSEYLAAINVADSWIFGEDEAITLTEKAQGFFLHHAYQTLSNKGIVINQVTNVSNRTALVVDETVRRYGFDVRVRYKRTDSRTDGTIGSVNTKRRGGLWPPYSKE